MLNLKRSGDEGVGEDGGVDGSYGAGDGGDHDGDGGDGGVDGVRKRRLSGRGEEEDGPEAVASRCGGMECRGIADGSCPRTEVLKRRSHGIAGARGKAGRRCKYRREKKSNKYLHAAAQPCFGNVFLQVSSLLS